MGNLWSSSRQRQQHGDDGKSKDDGIPSTEEELLKRYFGKEEDTEDTQDEERATRNSRRTKASLHCNYMLPTLSSMSSKKPQLQILDVGCGSGEITIDIAEMFPEAKIVGIDVSEAVLASARIYAEERGVENVEFLRRSVFDLSTEESWIGRFDVVYTHQVVSHFPNENEGRVGGIREMIKVVRKGGILCMREGDLRTGRFWPEQRYSVLQECFKVIIDVHEAEGGSADAGMQLKQWAVKAGLEKKKSVATYSVSSYDTLEGRRGYGGHWPGRCIQGVFARRAMELGVSSRRLDEYALAWKEWIEDEDGMFAMMHGEVIAKIT